MDGDGSFRTVSPDIQAKSKMMQEKHSFWSGAVSGERKSSASVLLLGIVAITGMYDGLVFLSANIN